MVEPAVLQRLHHGQVGVAQVHVFADDRDVHGIRRGVDPLDQVVPLGQVGRRVDAQVLRQDLVEPFALEHERDLVDRGRVGRAHDARHRHVAEQRDLLLQMPTDRPVRATHDRVRLQPERAQLLHRVLRGLGLQLPRGSDERHEADVHERAVLAAGLVAELADRLEEGERLDVAHRAADLDDEQVGGLGLGVGADPILDLVGDVRDDLDGLAEVVAPALLLDHGGVDGAGRDVRAPVEVLVGEALVVPQVKVGLSAVVEHEHLAVLEGVHRAGVDVDVRVQLLEGDADTARLEETTE